MTRAPRVVALGGGHGLAATLRALRRVTPEVTAVVTVADDGGSSGRLRSELGMLPPGDLRMALAALTGDDAWGRTWERALQHRFGGDGPLAGHAVGNLLIAGLWESTGDIVTALDLTAGLLGGVGRVLPMSCDPLEIVADVLGLDATDPTAIREVVGQVAVATTTGQVAEVRLRPLDPKPCEDSVAAVLAADWVVLGPGSWFTSVLPHLLVPGLRAALAETSARTVVCMNLAEQAGETDGLTPADHLAVLTDHAPDLHLDIVLADEHATTDRHGLMAAVTAAGGQLVLAPVASPDGSPRHDPLLLAAAFTSLFMPETRVTPATPQEDSAWP